MICTSCGTQMDESASACPNCGRPTGVIPADKPVIKDYLTVSIVLLAISCLCMGSFASLATGIDVMLFSGDKLLGGPQAGIIVGKKKYIKAMKKHPLARAMRVDKMTFAALEATLMKYRDRKTALRDIPVLRMISVRQLQLES